MDRPIPLPIIAAMFAAGLACLLVLACGCAQLPVAHLSGEHGQCGAILVRADRVLTTAHCAAADPPGAIVTCDGQQATVARWYPHPQYAENAAHDLAIGALDHALACYRPVSVASVDPGDVLLWRGQVAEAEATGPQTVIVDASPRKFCFGSSGEPVVDSWGDVVALVSRWWSQDSRGCSYHVRAAALAPEIDWLRRVP
jgi:hypothetical protein